MEYFLFSGVRILKHRSVIMYVRVKIVRKKKKIKTSRRRGLQGLELTCMTLVSQGDNSLIFRYAKNEKKLLHGFVIL